MSAPKTGRPPRSEKLKVIYLYESTFERWLKLKQSEGNITNNEFAQIVLDGFEKWKQGSDESSPKRRKGKIRPTF